MIVKPGLKPLWWKIFTKELARPHIPKVNTVSNAHIQANSKNCKSIDTASMVRSYAPTIDDEQLGRGILPLQLTRQGRYYKRLKHQKMSNYTLISFCMI